MRTEHLRCICASLLEIVPLRISRGFYGVTFWVGVLYERPNLAPHSGQSPAEVGTAFHTSYTGRTGDWSLNIATAAQRMLLPGQVVINTAALKLYCLPVAPQVVRPYNNLQRPRQACQSLSHNPHVRWFCSFTWPVRAYGWLSKL